ncbi:MarR family winged helix-turn-helix transcriptional regulator [Maribacter cobaltidurans]|jgi:DNA-binding MarR family transcriptional regulator|uniref:MarR family transcriptional regulator n=1 Tax=Maribacter cobaltidurans TaxID=1178778 RepID=A0A223V3I0_9FLAO|nr:MarR family transcriptional regulator [Maribacter cobaltidurans]ASV29965.1 MarR family transcriptional regulator [Maribacter cobaltidurans]GGD88332.1 MarR family transcriptional regulator [Maribacter cobaltidurans]
MNEEPSLELENQYCFPIYAASRVVTKLYTPLLNMLGLTYPQYLTMLVLWQYHTLTVNEIGDKLMLESNTLTPLLKRLENQELITRKRSSIDERVVEISLTKKGVELKQQANIIPEKLAYSIGTLGIDQEEMEKMKRTLQKLIAISVQKNR